MTEIQWLVDIILHHKLPVPLMEKFVARIGEVEANLSISKPQPRPLQPPAQQAQVPSMQKILDEMSSETPNLQAQLPPRIIIPTEVVTSKGNGGYTKGPRKF